MLSSCVLIYYSNCIKLFTRYSLCLRADADLAFTSLHFTSLHFTSQTCTDDMHLHQSSTSSYRPLKNTLQHLELFNQPSSFRSRTQRNVVLSFITGA